MSEPRPAEHTCHDELDPGLKAAFARSPMVEGLSSVLEVVARLTGSAPKVVLRDAADGAPTPVLDPSAERHAGTAGRTSYQLLGEIARGGMGVILRGHDQDLGRDVAMKVLHEKLASRPEMVQRFVEEAQIGGQLQHPGIVPVYELGLMADQRPYFTMKLVKGRTLAALLSERTEVEDRRKLLDVFEAVCQTMAYAHSRGVIHRDLKPANVMVGAFGEVQVVDWGLAKVLRRDGDDAQRPRAPEAAAISIIETVRSAPGSAGSQSVVGSVLGTPAYMPPEQARGDVEHLDERSDVFSLGAILCEILTGQPPYVGAAEQTVILAAQGKLEEAITRIDGCGADAELIALCKQCLMPAPLARPRSAEVLAEKLHAYLTSVEQRAQSARVEAAEAQVQASAERKARHLTLSLAAAVLALVLLGGGGAWWFEQREGQRRRETEQTVTAALSEATLARGRQDWAATTAALDRAQARLDAGAATAELRSQVAATRTEIEREAKAAEQAARLQVDNAAMLAALRDVRQPEGETNYPRDWAVLDGQYHAIFAGRSLEVDAGQLDALAAVLSRRGISVELAAAFDGWALVRDKAQNHGGAARLSALASMLDRDPFRAALRPALAAKDVTLLRRLAASDGMATLPSPTLWLLAQALIQGEIVDQAVAVLEAGRLRFASDFSLAMELGRSLLLVEPRRTAEAVAHFSAALAMRPENVEAWHELGRTLHDLGQHERAVEVFRAAIGRWPMDAHLHMHLGAELAHTHDLEHAIVSSRRAVELDPRAADAHGNLGAVLAERGLLDEAIDSYQQALVLDPKSAATLNNLALAFAKQGRLEQAIASHRAALALDSKSIDFHMGLAAELITKGDLDQAIVVCNEALHIDPKCVDAYGNLGEALTRQEHLEEAIATFNKLLALDPRSAQGHFGLGNALMNQGKLNEATESYRHAVALDPKLADAYVNLGSTLVQTGHPDEALEYLARALALAPKDPAVHTNQGNALAAQGRLDQAIASYRRAIELAATFVEAHWNLGNVLARKGEHDAAMASYRRAVALGVKMPKGLNDVARWLATRPGFDLADAQEAVRYALAAVQQLPSQGPYWNTLGVTQYRAGEYAECARALERSIELTGGGEASDWLFLAMAQQRQGNTNEARRWYQRAVDWWNKQTTVSEERQRFRAEAEQVLGIKPEAKRE